MKPVEVPECFCPSCGGKLSAATALKAGTTPSPGDISLCAGCGQWLVYDEGLRSRMPTKAEETEILSDPRLSVARMIAIELAKQRNLRQ